MAKTKKHPKKNIGGPYLASAVFCDSLVRGEDGAMTVVRIIDNATLTLPDDAPSDVPSEEKKLLMSLEGLIVFKRGDAGGRHVVKLVAHSPSGKDLALHEQPFDFRDEMHGGYNLRLKVNMAIAEPGLYWVDVLLDGKQMTRMPLMIIVKRAESASTVRKSAGKKAKKSR